MIEVRHLTKLYGDHPAVDDLSFIIPDGTICGFLGANGAGKTTTMNIMTGYLSPTDGVVLINGHDIFEEPEEAKKTIGYLPELPPVYPEMTVREYLRFAAELKAVPKRERAEQIGEVLRELELEDVAGRLIRNLSKGYKQRVGFAQALLGSPETLILDEPTVGLDPKQIIEIRRLIKKLGKKHTVILSSHILTEVSEVCDKILIIDSGRLVASGTPAELAAAGRGGTRLLVCAEGSVSQVKTALGVLPCAEEITVSRVEGETRAVIPVPAGTDLRAAASRALFDAGLMILEMRTEEESLERLFLELTEEAAADTGDIDTEEVDG